MKPDKQKTKNCIDPYMESYLIPFDKENMYKQYVHEKLLTKFGMLSHFKEVKMIQSNDTDPQADTRNHFKLI